MNIFGYIYYRAKEFYIKYDKNSSVPEFSSVILVSTIQFLNFVSIFLISSYVFKFKIEVGIFYGLIPAIIILAINYFLFESYNIGEKKYNLVRASESKNKSKLKGFLIILFIVVSMIVC